MAYQLEQFGGGVSAANNSPAWDAMVAQIAVVGTSAEIQLNAGTYTFLWTPSPISLVGPQNVAIHGVSRRVSRLFFNNCNGISALYSSSPWCAVHLRDFGITTNTASQYTALSLAFQPGVIPNPNPALNATTDLVRLSIGGDGLGEFATGIQVVGISQINYDNVEVFGLGNEVGVGVWLTGGPTIAGVHNFRTLNASFVGIGLLYGASVQGVTVTAGSNFTGNSVGIQIAAATGAAEQFQLSVSDSQFDVYGFGILDQSGCNGMTIRGNLFIVNAGAIGILTPAPYPNIIGNEFTGTQNTNGVVIEPTGAGAMMLANRFNSITTGIWLQQGASGCTAIANVGTILDATGTNTLQFNSASAVA